MQFATKAALLAATALSMNLAMPAFAQDAQGESADELSGGNDIIVTARRVEERLQDVPISVTVLNSETLANNNINSAKDIATYTPGLTTNNRYGADSTTWTIRGFTQEQRTTATVGTYFADVVAPRGSGATPGGDGAGPGSLFDLQNVQVLKGPQGTLFGRNSTGGAVLLVPRKPTDRLEGYIEGGVGNYDMWRVQGVINAPLSDNVRLRIGVDRNKRDGYMKNAGLLGYGPHGDAGASVDYWAARASLVIDVTPAIENYTIASYSKSKSTGLIPKITQCFPTSPYPTYATPTSPPTFATLAAGTFACQQMAREAPLGFWSVSNPLPDSASRLETWQIINTTTWEASDDLTVKNIFSYAEFTGDTNLDLFGYYRPIVTPGTETNGNQVQPFNTTHALPGAHTQSQSSLVEELQFQGKAAEGRLVWQGGLYLEVNNPKGLSGIQSTTQTPCADLTTFNCVPGQNANSIGRLAYQTNKTWFRGKAAYFQASYDITDRLKLTGGIRYTEDTMRAEFALAAVRLYSAPVTSVVNGITTVFPAGNFFYCLNDNARAFGQPGSASNPFRPLDQRFGACAESRKTKTSAPTWLLGIDYKPIPDVLLYAKWSRGYRQGGIAAFAADQFQTFDKERVDTYEIGAKASWRGAMPGYFNISAFHNDFRDQQLQIGLSCNPVSLCAQTTAIVNAASSKLRGFEAELGVNPFEGLRLEAAYAYLNTKVNDIIDLRAQVVALGLPFTDIRPVPVGSPIPNAMPHKFTASMRYTLPLDESVGKITLGGTFVYSSRYRAVSDPFLPGTNNLPIVPFQYASEYGVLPSSNILNLNVNWENVGSLPVDAAFFITNVTNEKVYLHSNVQAAQGFVSNLIGEPRMWGFRLKYKFGQ